MRATCFHGHPFSEENTRLELNKQRGTIQRRCKVCAREKQRRYYQRKRGVR